MMTFLALNAGALFVAVRLALAAGSRVRASHVALCVLCGYLAVIHTTVLAAGLLGWLTVGGMATVTTIAVAGAWWFARGKDGGDTAAADVSRLTRATLFAPLLAIATAVAWTWPHLSDATRLWIWDDYTYHMVYPTIWLREHAIAAAMPPQVFTMQAWYPMSAGVVATWFMAPFQGSRGEALAWVSLTAALYAGIVVSAAAELFARVGCRRLAWTVPVVLFATSHRTGVMASSFSDADLAVAAALFGAVTFAIPRGPNERPREVDIDTWYAALLTGFAVGIKPSAAPGVVIILVVALVRAHTRATWRSGARVALVFGASWLVMAGYWYARNVAHTGNPVYPAALLGWPGATFPQTTLREYSQHYGLARTVTDALPVYTNWPHYHGALAVVGLVGLAAWLGTRRTPTRPQAYFAVATLVIAAATLALLPVTPYSAGNAMTFVSGFIHWDSMRYVALLPILGWVALGFLLDAGAGARGARTIVATVVMAAAVLAGLTRFAAVIVLTVAVAGAALGALIRFPADAPRLARRVGRPALATSAFVVAAIFMSSHGPKAAATAAAFYREPLFGAAAAVLDRQPAGTRVAVFGDQWIYPAFGDRDHLVPVRLDGDGRVSATPIGDAMAPGPLTVDAQTFAANLTASRMDVVAVVHLPHPGRSPEWPAQHRALEAAGARMLHRDGAVAVWKLRETGGAGRDCPRDPSAWRSARCHSPSDPR